jgi:hypothetical protein
MSGPVEPSPEPAAGAVSSAASSNTATPAPRVGLVRGLLLATGVVVTAVGLWRLLQLGLHNLFATAVWLGGGVITHDAVLAPVTVALVFAATRVLPSWWRAPVAAGAVVLGTVTVGAIPVLGRFGARSDDPTLLDRNYQGGWLVLTAAVAVAVAFAGWRRRSAQVPPAPERSTEARAGSRRPPI